MTTVAPVKTYHVRDGYRFTEADALVIGPFLEALAAQLGQPYEQIRAEQILAAAEPEESPIHAYFEWDDSAAARQWRLEQARYLARSWRVEIIEPQVWGPTTYSVPGMVNLTMPVSDERAYIPVSQVQEHAELRMRLLAQAKRELRAYLERFAMLRDIPAMRSLFEVGELWAAAPDDDPALAEANRDSHDAEPSAE